MFRMPTYIALCFVTVLCISPRAVAEQSAPEETRPCSQSSPSYPEAQCLADLANYYHSHRNYADEVRIARRLVSVRERAAGNDGLDLAEALERLGNALIFARSFSEAELALNRAVDIEEKAPGRTGQKLGDTLHFLGQAYLLDGKYPDAEKAFSHSLAARQKAFPRGSGGYANVAESFEDLGTLYEVQGNLEEAQSRFESAVQVLDQDDKPGPDAFLMTSDLDQLGRLYAREGKYEDAERQFKRALGLTDEQGLRSLAVPTLRDYAALLDATNRPIEAQQLRDRADAIVNAEHQHTPAPVIVRP